MSIESVIRPIGDAAGAIGKTIGNIGGAVNTLRGLTGSGSRRTTRYIDLAGDAAGAQADIAREQARLAREQWRTYKNNFLPLEKARAAEARRDLNLFRPLKKAAVAEGLSGLRRAAPLEHRLYSQAMQGVEPDIDRAVSDASAQVRKSFAKVRDRADREAQSQGFQPARLSYLDRITDLDQAASEASARTAAARAEKARAEDLSWRRLNNAMSIQRGLPSLPASSLAPVTASGLGSEAAARAADLMRSAAGGLGRAAGDYVRAGRELQPLEAKSLGLAATFSPATDLTDAWTASGMYGMPAPGRHPHQP